MSQSCQFSLYGRGRANDCPIKQMCGYAGDQELHSTPADTHYFINNCMSAPGAAYNHPRTSSVNTIERDPWSIHKGFEGPSCACQIVELILLERLKLPRYNPHFCRTISSDCPATDATRQPTHGFNVVSFCPTHCKRHWRSWTALRELYLLRAGLRADIQILPRTFQAIIASHEDRYILGWETTSH